MVYLFSLYLFKVFFKVFYNIKFIGVENLPKKGGIIAPNHVSFLDGPLIAISTPFPLYFFGKKKFFDKKLLGLLLKGLNTYPIEKGVKSSKALNIASDLLREDKFIVIFPEGTRSRSGELGMLKRGVGKLAMQNKKPIIPVWIEGLYESWPRDQKVPKFFHSVTCVFGTPIYPSDYLHLSKEEATEELLVDLEKELLKLSVLPQE